MIAAVHKNCLQKIQNDMESLLGMKMKEVVENEIGEVDYLQMKIGRNAINNSIHIRWFQKEYSARHIIDFNSFHPRRMKNSVVNEFIRRTL